MDNCIYLKGIVKNIQYSHTIGNIIYNKADLIVKRSNGKEDLISIKYKQYSGLDLKENQEIEFVGNIRSYTHKINNKNKVDIYVFSYLDKEIELDIDLSSLTNYSYLQGKICKKDDLRNTKSGKQYIHFIIANNIVIDESHKLNSYIPCVAWGELAINIDKNYNVNDDINVVGELHSREYIKHNEDNTEIKLAHEFYINEVK